MEQQTGRPHLETIAHPQLSIVDLEKCVKANVEGTNNVMRQKAEDYLSNLRSNQPNDYISGLSQLLAQSKDNNVRSFSAVLLRQSMGILDNSFDNAPIKTKNDLKQLLLNIAQNETDRNVLLQVSQLVGVLACKVLHSGMSLFLSFVLCCCFHFVFYSFLFYFILFVFFACLLTFCADITTKKSIN